MTEEETVIVPAQVPETDYTDKSTYEKLCERVNAIAFPLASRKQTKKIYKLIKKAAALKQKEYLRHGLADVQKALRKDEKGLVVLAGNVSPIDIYTHIPGMCSEKNLPYIFTPAREHLGIISGHKRPTITMMVKEHESYAELFKELSEIILHLDAQVEAA